MGDKPNGKPVNGKHLNGKKWKVEGWNDASGKIREALDKLEQDTEANLNDLRRRVRNVQHEAVQVGLMAKDTRRSSRS